MLPAEPAAPGDPGDPLDPLAPGDPDELGVPGEPVAPGWAPGAPLPAGGLDGLPPGLAAPPGSPLEEVSGAPPGAPPDDPLRLDVDSLLSLGGVGHPGGCGVPA